MVMATTKATDTDTDDEQQKIAYYPLKMGMGRFFSGSLETAVMEAVWYKIGKEGYVGVNEVYEYVLDNYGDIRYTTVSRVLTRLAKKGILEIGEGELRGHRCLIFTPVHGTRLDFETDVIRIVLASILEHNRGNFIAWIINNMDEFLDIKTDGSTPKIGKGYRKRGSI
jgi:predicted transcriptional regulator